ncbi:XRE family transcriptional regulator [Caballeronia udeis]|uniref:XRE family transcriptional regulator n=1 Tax=Caballeronia udeis TaxID=1232866 RepID=UPI00384CA4FF
MNQSYSGTYIRVMDIATRLDEAMQLRGFGSNQSALSRASGVPQPTINRILKGKTPTPDVETLRKLSEALSVGFTWLSDGTLPVTKLANSAQNPLLSSGKTGVEVWETEADLKSDESRVWIDKFSYHFSAGAGVIQWEVQQKNALPINVTVFRNNDANPKDCRLLEARGDSMEPYLSDRDVFLIDTASINVVDGERYAVFFEGESLVKQIFKQVGGAVVLHSYNPKYPDKTVPREMIELVQVVGRVIYRAG